VKKFFVLFLIAFFIIITSSNDAFAQGGLYTFKYILKPKYKVRTHFTLSKSANQDGYAKKQKIKNKRNGDENTENTLRYDGGNIFSFFTNSFDALFTGGGYTRKFNMTDVIFINDTFYRIQADKTFFKPFSIETNFLIPKEEKIFMDNDYLNKKLDTQLVPCLKFDSITQRFDEIDSTDPGNWYSSNRYLFPTYKRARNTTNSDDDFDNDGDNHTRFLKFKYGIDVLFKKGQVKHDPDSTEAKDIETKTYQNLIHLPIDSKTESLIIVKANKTTTVNVTSVKRIKNSDYSNYSFLDDSLSSVVIKDSSSTKQGYVSYRIVGKDGNTLSHPKMKFNLINKPNSDTLMITPWFRREVSKHSRNKGLKLINNAPLGDKNDSIVFKDHRVAKNEYQDTFYIEIPNNYTINKSNSTYNKFNLEFNGKYFIPVNITFQDIGFSIHKPLILTPNFISAGMAYGWAHGKTTFFKDNQLTSKNFYFGVGFVGSLSSAADLINKSNTYPALCVGGHLGVAISSIQVLIAGGYGVAFGDSGTAWGKNGAPWVGFGVGLNLFALTIPGIGSGGGGH